jgi:hypothetical protein
MKKAMIILLMMMFIVPTFYGQPFINKYGKVSFDVIEDERKMEVRLANITEKCTIKLLDKFGAQLFSDFYWNQRGYAKKLNLKDLPSGNYKIFIESEHWICEQPIELFSNDVHVLEEMQNWYILPTLQYQDETLMVRRSHEKAIKAKEIAFFDQSGEEVFSYNLKKENPNTDILFNLSNLEVGKYEVALYTDVKTITKTVTRY